jgi:hypothetical protein
VQPDAVDFNFMVAHAVELWRIGHRG